MTDVSLEELFADVSPPPDPLWVDLVDMIKARNAATPRHLQEKLGPSQVSHPCMRKMAFGLTVVPRCNPDYDPLPSIIGVATHKWLDSAVRLANNNLGRQRWLAETKVNVAQDLAGTCDLYDFDTATVIDWKIVGYTSFDKYLKDPGPQYRGQVHLYGKGFENAGLPVKRVAIAFLPRAGTLSKMHLWQAEYKPELADYILKKREAVISMLSDFDVEHNPDRYQWIPKDPFDCYWCPWFRAVPTSPLQCSGDE